MTALEEFYFGGDGIRTFSVDGEIWFVAADVARALGYSATEAMTRSMDAEEKALQNLQTPGGLQSVTIITESGLYEAILRSRTPNANEFRRWVKREVLPSIRRTGAYTVPETPEQAMARAVLVAQGIIERRDEQIAELTPRAEAWDELAAAEGDFAVADAAKMLARSNIVIGPNKLFEFMRSISWTFRGADGRWRAYADKVGAGYLAERPQSHHHPRTGELVIDAPQLRITVRGLDRLRVRLSTPKQVAS